MTKRQSKIRTPELASDERPSIYGLFCKDGNLRYIGKANNPTKRLQGHMRDAKRRSTPVYCWIRKHGRPEMRILEAECRDWCEAEKRLIAEARERGDNLLNVADGGDEPHCHAGVRAANAKLLQVHPKTIEQRKKNAKFLNAASSDPIHVANTNLLRRLGRSFSYVAASGADGEEVEKRRATLCRIKEFVSENRELFFCRAMQNKVLREILIHG